MVLHGVLHGVYMSRKRPAEAGHPKALLPDHMPPCQHHWLTITLSNVTQKSSQLRYGDIRSRLFKLVWWQLKLFAYDIYASHDAHESRQT